MTTYVRIIDNKTTVRFPAALPVTALDFLQQAVDALRTAGKVYDSDESAALDGIALNKLYLTASNHVEAPGGLIRIRLV
jgi:hypothetical protein